MEHVVGPGMPFFIVSTHLSFVFTNLDIDFKAAAEKILSAILMEREGY